LRDIIEEEKNKTIDEVANSLIEDAKAGQTTERIFFLKAQAAWREKSEVVHSGTVKHELELEVIKRIDQMDATQRAERLKELQELEAMDTETIDVEFDEG